jgi:hypothetical protein
MDEFKVPVTRSNEKTDEPAEFVTPEKVAEAEEASFTPPEEVAAKEELTPEQTSTAEPLNKTPPKIKHHLKFSKKQWLIICAVTLIIIGGGATAYALLHKTTPTPKIAAKVSLPVKKTVTPSSPTTVASTLTGLPVSPSINQQPVTAVMIENSTFARPQSGLDQAGVVFEAIAEGGITRFVALFQDTAPSYIGPVRSVRPYYLDWLSGFDAAVAHVGGSGEALQDISSWGIKDMNQFYNGSYFERISSRVAPHNVYTSIAQLNALETAKGFNTSKYTGFLRKPDQPAKVPTATTINFNISSADYDVQYKYNATNNDYLRFEGGEPHMEISQSGVQTQITPKVVIAMVMANSLEADNIHNVYAAIGSGPVYVFQDGIVTKGTWSKPTRTQQITFTASNGSPIKLDAGYTWLTALGSTSYVTYTN